MDNIFNEINEIEIDEEFIFDEEEDSESEERFEAIKNRKLFTDRADRSLADLCRMIDQGDLILQPDYQRGFVWKPKQTSMFIESLLLSIPIPTVFFAENPDGTFEVVDGQQRLTSIYKFKNDDISLSGLTTLTEYNRTKFSDLDQAIKRSFDNKTLSTVIIKKESTPEIKFDIFSRINQGSVKLNDQELRNVVYRGYLIESTTNFAKSNDIVARIFKKNSTSRKRKVDQEFILRLLAMNEMVQNGVLKESYNGRIRDSITSYLEKYRNDEEYVTEEFEKMSKILNRIDEIFEGNPFRIFDKSKNDYFTRINKSVADLQYIYFGSIDIDKDLSYYENKFNDFVNDNIGLFKSRTGNTTTFQQRLSIFNEETVSDESKTDS